MGQQIKDLLKSYLIRQNTLLVFDVKNKTNLAPIFNMNDNDDDDFEDQVQSMQRPNCQLCALLPLRRG